jgi:hypothetical protein
VATQLALIVLFTVGERYHSVNLLREHHEVEQQMLEVMETTQHHSVRQLPKELSKNNSEV